MTTAKANFTDVRGQDYRVRANNSIPKAEIETTFDIIEVAEKDAPRVASMILSAYLNASVEDLADSRARLRVGEGVNSSHFLVPTNDATAEYLLNTGLCALLAYNGYMTQKEEEAAAEASEELEAEAFAYFKAYYGYSEATLEGFREDMEDHADFLDVAREARKLLGQTTK